MGLWIYDVYYYLILRRYIAQVEYKKYKYHNYTNYYLRKIFPCTKIENLN